MAEIMNKQYWESVTQPFFEKHAEHIKELKRLEHQVQLEEKAILSMAEAMGQDVNEVAIKLTNML